MRHTLVQYFGYLLKAWWALAISGGAGVLGMLIDMFGWANVPWWVWGLIIGSGLIIAQFVAFHHMRVERDSDLPDSLYNTTAHDAYCYLRNLGLEIDVIISELRQKLSDGSMVCWGRNQKHTVLFNGGPLIKIPHDYWQDYSIDMTTLIEHPDNLDRGTVTECMIAGAKNKTIFSDLHVNMAQIFQHWPSPPIWKRIKIRSPIYLEGRN